MTMINRYLTAIAWLGRLPAPDMNLFIRVWVAIVFYSSSRTKVDGGFLSLSDSTKLLFEYEYQVPFLSVEVAATMALYLETFAPILLIIGLASRLSAIPLLGMTAVIQLFVYPTSWADHIMWAIALIFIILRGPGMISIDHLIRRQYDKS